jgi:hypothetical protein
MTPRRTGLAALLSAALLAHPRPAGASGDLAYKYADYREADGRIGVTTSSVLAEQDLGPDMRVKLGGVLDSIAGATPTGERAPDGSDQVPTSGLRDIRRAWNAELSRQFGAVNVAAGFARSLEHDYVSNGWSVNTLTDLNRKNTTLLVGAAGTDDKVLVAYRSLWLPKRGNTFVLGATQLLDPLTSVSLDLTWGRSTGFLTDPYKLVQKAIPIVPGVYLPETFAENRPWERNTGDALLSLDRAFPAVRGALEAGYRYYADTFGTEAHTVEVSWYQHVGGRFALRPEFRYYRQGAAGFYAYNLDATPVVPTRNPTSRGPFYSSDARLSAFQASTWGLRAVWSPVEAIQFDLAEEAYRQRGTDGVTPQSAYYRAAVTTVGLKVSW